MLMTQQLRLLLAAKLVAVARELVVDALAAKLVVVAKEVASNSFLKRGGFLLPLFF